MRTRIISNCLFCYCPLYLLGTECGGTYQILAGGVKDCSDCLFPHQPENYDKVVQKLKQKIFKPFDKNSQRLDFFLKHAIIDTVVSTPLD
jgi:Zn-finger protein